jgi:uncharacterized damage-inducible protein DinB
MKQPADPLREQLARMLDWEEAHAGFEKAIEGIPAGSRGLQPAGFEHTLWQLLEHMRVAQRDLLDFCVNPQYVHSLKWPDDYWPRSLAPAGKAAWDKSIADFRTDREKLKKLVRNADVDLFAAVPTGKDQQTYLRAILLVTDHNAYHLGQMIAVRRALGIWP